MGKKLQGFEILGSQLETLSDFIAVTSLPNWVFAFKIENLDDQSDIVYCVCITANTIDIIV